MAPPQKVIATESQLKSFDWLDLEQWDVDHLFNFYGVDGKKLCKICDKWVCVGDLTVHAKKHKNARIALKKKEHEEAMARAAETRRLKREEKARERENRTK